MSTVKTITLTDGNGKNPRTLTRADYVSLKESGTLWEFHPDAPMQWPFPDATPSPAASAIARADGDLIALNAAALRLFKGQYRDSGDRHSDALFVLEGLVLLQERLAPLDAARVRAEELFERHTTAVGEFLNELYALSVDPLAEGTRTVAETKQALLAAAERDRDLRARLLAVESKRDEALSSASELSESFAFLGLDPAGIKTQLLVEVDRRQKAESANATNCGSLQRHMKWNDELKLALTAAEARCAALEADKERLDWLEFQLRNMDSTKGGTWLRIGDKGRVQIHRSPSPHHPTEHIWWDYVCELDSIPDKACGVRDALDAARQPDVEGAKP